MNEIRHTRVLRLHRLVGLRRPSSLTSPETDDTSSPSTLHHHDIRESTNFLSELKQFEAERKKKKKTIAAMDVYLSTLDSVGEAILSWADPQNKFRGYTEVRSFRLLCYSRLNFFGQSISLL